MLTNKTFYYFQTNITEKSYYLQKKFVVLFISNTDYFYIHIKIVWGQTFFTKFYFFPNLMPLLFNNCYKHLRQKGFLNMIYYIKIIDYEKYNNDAHLQIELNKKSNKLKKITWNGWISRYLKTRNHFDIATILERNNILTLINKLSYWSIEI